jgi:hypothetical protein
MLTAPPTNDPIAAKLLTKDEARRGARKISGDFSFCPA